MARPSKLKRAIKKMEEENKTYELEIKSREFLISNNLAMIGKLRKIDNEKNNKD